MKRKFKKVNCECCMGKGYIEFPGTSGFLFFSGRKSVRAHCPICLGHKFQWEIKDGKKQRQ